MKSNDARSWHWRALPLAISALLIGCEETKKGLSPASTSDEQSPPASEAPPVKESTPEAGLVAQEEAIPKIAAAPKPNHALGDLPEAADSKPFVLTDLNMIKVNPGSPSPKVGDLIYTMTNLPVGTCGEYWVQNPDGSVGLLAQCNGLHEGGH